MDEQTQEAPEITTEAPREPGAGMFVQLSLLLPKPVYDRFRAGYDAAMEKARESHQQVLSLPEVAFNFFMVGWQMMELQAQARVQATEQREQRVTLETEMPAQRPAAPVPPRRIVTG